MTMTTMLETIREVHLSMPSRHSVAVIHETITASRPSLGRTDRPDAIGSIARHPRGCGIVRRSHKECHDGDWLIVSEIGAPETDAERDAIAISMARRWDDAMASVISGRPDDDRARAAHETRQIEYRRLRQMLVSAGMLA